MKNFYWNNFNPLGELNAIKHLVIEGYDHVIDVHEDDNIVNIAYSRGHEEMGKFLEGIPNFEVCFQIFYSL